MSTHDRGAFGALLAEAKALHAGQVTFVVDLEATDESDLRWIVYGRGQVGTERTSGRTGEEALRRLVEKLRVAPGGSQA